MLIPIGHVQGIFAKETGEGMGFEVEVWQPKEENQVQTMKSLDEKEKPKTKKKILKLE